MSKPRQFPNHVYASYFPRFVSFFDRRVHDTFLAEDLAAITLKNAALHWHKLQTPESPGPWLWRIARNVLKTHMRDQNRVKRKGTVVPIDALENSTDFVPGQDLERDFLVRERLQRITDYIEELPTPMRLTVQTYFLRECDLNETAKIMNVPAGTVKSRINKFRKAVRQWEQAQAPDLDQNNAADESSSSRSNT
ncbi:RNA polymerase sigma factor [Acanthopleuribacter pedis]|uniref:RNA polymerase sigma factor n=1 Tax=Acanthopleuribacter pedis TaxID=442870 RepID=A0A8J7U5I1_9BACT|nr:RNA polymerase sigma factor [Acanthopleuribacter pedis]MBO1320473.1 RNA polymerase sigma factor [Acanthopleuribacter pedis]